MAFKKVCKECGSDDIWADAAAEWCVDSQAWVLGSTFDHVECRKCDGRTEALDVHVNTMEYGHRQNQIDAAGNNWRVDKRSIMTSAYENEA